jgi:hypothetical protein
VINNLKIERIEVRSEDDPAIAPYVHEKQIEFIKCEKGGESVLQTAKKVPEIIIRLFYLNAIALLSSLSSLTIPVIRPISDIAKELSDLMISAASRLHEAQILNSSNTSSLNPFLVAEAKK